jgi:hypothetical protein
MQLIDVLRRRGGKEPLGHQSGLFEVSGLGE